MERRLLTESMNRRWIRLAPHCLAHSLRYLSITASQRSDMALLFQAYSALHTSVMGDLKKSNEEVSELVPSLAAMSIGAAIDGADIKQLTMLQPVHTNFTKVSTLFASFLAFAAHNVLMPREFAKCCVQSYPFMPDSAALIRVSMQSMGMAALPGLQG